MQLLGLLPLRAGAPQEDARGAGPAAARLSGLPDPLPDAAEPGGTPAEATPGTLGRPAAGARGRGRGEGQGPAGHARNAATGAAARGRRPDAQVGLLGLMG